ncbi:hypothetical protein FB45DRAFT_999620 [Roridomyces roridus]|uniref:Uncharacterized protein n=1 Tax=Roridomyces roridus TaxID=1738132 RepID=A0AAD7CC12_9AGAR|nr:hypothetical protein FB45DRAFT_999620 [Roridomyces roridus]
MYRLDGVMVDPMQKSGHRSELKNNTVWSRGIYVALFLYLGIGTVRTVYGTDKLTDIRTSSDYVRCDTVGSSATTVRYGRITDVRINLVAHVLKARNWLGRPCERMLWAAYTADQACGGRRKSIWMTQTHRLSETIKIFDIQAAFTTLPTKPSPIAVYGRIRRIIRTKYGLGTVRTTESLPATVRTPYRTVRRGSRVHGRIILLISSFDVSESLSRPEVHCFGSQMEDGIVKRSCTTFELIWPNKGVSAAEILTPGGGGGGGPPGGLKKLFDLHFKKVAEECKTIQKHSSTPRRLFWMALDNIMAILVKSWVPLYSKCTVPPVAEFATGDRAD